MAKGVLLLIIFPHFNACMSLETSCYVMPFPPPVLRLFTLIMYPLALLELHEVCTYKTLQQKLYYTLETWPGQIKKSLMQDLCEVDENS